MRALILMASLALAACGNNDQTDNTQNLDENSDCRQYRFE